MGGLKREEIIQLLRKELPYLRERYGVKEVALFGSFAKGSEGEGSDVDILVELSKSLGLDFVELACS
jgi:predicted nucleotidyltransferase